MTWVAEQFLLTVPGIDDVHGGRDRSDNPERDLGALRDSGRGHLPIVVRPRRGVSTDRPAGPTPRRPPAAATAGAPAGIVELTHHQPWTARPAPGDQQRGTRRPDRTRSLDMSTDMSTDTSKRPRNGRREPRAAGDPATTAARTVKAAATFC